MGKPLPETHGRGDEPILETLVFWYMRVTEFVSVNNVEGVH